MRATANKRTSAANEAVVAISAVPQPDDDDGAVGVDGGGCVVGDGMQETRSSSETESTVYLVMSRLD